VRILAAPSAIAGVFAASRAAAAAALRDDNGRWLA